MTHQEMQRLRKFRAKTAGKVTKPCQLRSLLKEIVGEKFGNNKNLTFKEGTAEPSSDYQSGRNKMKKM